jgi:type IV pilus assembly protein PilM
VNFARFQRSPPSPLVGLDINPNFIKLVVINNAKPPFQIENIAIGLVPPNIIIKNEIKDPTTISNLLKGLFAQAEIESKFVALAIPRSLAIIKTTPIDSRLSAADIESRAWLEANRHFPDLVGEIYLDFTVDPLPQDSSQLELTLIACRKDQIKPYLEVLQQASLTPKIVDVATYALERALTMVREQFVDLETVALLNLDINLSTFVVIQNKKLVYANDQSFDGSRLLAQAPEGTNRMDMFKENLSAHLRHTVHIFYSSRPQITIQKVVISGDCAVIPDLQLYLQEELGIDTIMANPFANMSIATRIKPDLLQTSASTLMLGCGLALSKLR